MRKFVSYLRVSTQRQGASGLGLDAQREAVSHYISDQKGIALAEFVEIESGKVRDRPVLAQSIARCQSEKATLVIAKLDRLGRNVAFVSSLMEAGIDFVAADAPYANRLMIHILSAFAEHERTMIAERTRAALAAAKARGVQLGANGHRLAARNRSDAQAFAERYRHVVAEIMDGRTLTLAEVAAEVNRRSILTRDGAAWSPGTIKRLLDRLRLRNHTLI